VILWRSVDCEGRRRGLSLASLTSDGDHSRSANEASSGSMKDDDQNRLCRSDDKAGRDAQVALLADGSLAARLAKETGSFC